MIDADRIRALAVRGESEMLEFKRVVVPDIGKTVCAFSNADGGTILIGIDDKGSIVGAQSTRPLSLDEQQQRIYHSVQECSPAPIVSIKAVPVGPVTIIVIEIPKLYSGVCYYKNEIYVRVGTTDHKISGPAVEDFLKKRQILSFEEELSEASLEDISSEKVSSYVKRKSPESDFNPSRIGQLLVTLRLARMDGQFRIKKSALLMFAKNVSQFIPQCQVKLVRFQGTTPVIIADALSLSETVIESMEKSLEFIRKHTETRYKIESLVREEIPEYPPVAIREALVNAIAHRDYYSPAATQINIFDDRIEFVNPGSLPRELKIQDLPFLGLGIPRNPSLYSLLSAIKIIEGIGTGFPRIFQALSAAGLPDPHIEEVGPLFKVAFYNHLSPSERGGLNERQRRIMAYLREHKIASSARFKNLTGKSQPTIWFDLQDLMKRGLVERVGKGRGTRYALKKT
ncbi:MAG: putative DNA binding domain-containing protein [Candidatus Aenigmarchaeota archaeon]|nr:putative DNA binding domain-containing protein [Candidatus Aenigmarchaeota archaeon]